jgi:hypothetical protein
MTCGNVMNDVSTNISKSNLKIPFEAMFLKRYCDASILYALLFTIHLIFISNM